MTIAALNITDQGGGKTLIALSGDWTIQGNMPDTAEVSNVIGAPSPPRVIIFDTEQLTDWDSRLVSVLVRLINNSSERKIDVQQDGLPDGVKGLLRLAYAVPEREGARRTTTVPSFLASFGQAALDAAKGMRDTMPFVGEATIAFGRFLRGRAQYRRSDLWVVIQEAGADALPIVSLISLLVGVILAFVGAIQLEKFGAQIYIADLVGVGMTREMGAMMTAIIMAGRTGAAFAAQLGTMTVNEEIDALETRGVEPMDFLVLPRMLALMIMMPLLCLYANLMGIIGGMMVGVGMMDLGFMQYFEQTRGAVTLVDFAGGLVKATLYGTIVALAGCLDGMRSGRSAAAVGIATTSAVVKAITYIVIACAITTVIYHKLGI